MQYSVQNSAFSGYLANAYAEAVASGSMPGIDKQAGSYIPVGMLNGALGGTLGYQVSGDPRGAAIGALAGIMGGQILHDTPYGSLVPTIGAAALGAKMAYDQTPFWKNRNSALWQGVAGGALGGLAGYAASRLLDYDS